jgi:signal transduction histidine kinase
MTAIKPRSLSVLLACALCLSSYLAIRRITPDWDISGQVSVPLVFLAVYGYGAIIHELALAHTAKDVANARLAAAHTQLQEYSAQVEELSVIRERNRIAREIHDTLGHALTLLSVQLETATQLEARGDPRLHEELLQARQVAKACLTEVRHSVEALRPEALDGSDGVAQRFALAMLERRRIEAGTLTTGQFVSFLAALAAMTRDQLLHIGCADGGRMGAIAVKVGLSGRAELSVLTSTSEKSNKERSTVSPFSG